MSTAKANFPPNGADFPTGATGRFSNGRNMADYIGNTIYESLSSTSIGCIDHLYMLTLFLGQLRR
ncbi:GDSL esterase/lipase At2g19010 [Linum grandiflorum]